MKIYKQIGVIVVAAVFMLIHSTVKTAIGGANCNSLYGLFNFIGGCGIMFFWIWSVGRLKTNSSDK